MEVFIKFQNYPNAIVIKMIYVKTVWYICEDRYAGQWDQTEGLETDQQMCQSNSMAKRNISPDVVWGRATAQKWKIMYLNPT